MVANNWTEWVDAGEQSIVVEYPNLLKEEIVDKKDFLLAQTFSLSPYLACGVVGRSPTKEKLYQKNYTFLAQVLSFKLWESLIKTLRRKKVLFQTEHVGASFIND